MNATRNSTRILRRGLESKVNFFALKIVKFRPASSWTNWCNSIVSQTGLAEPSDAGDFCDFAAKNNNFNVITITHFKRFWSQWITTENCQNSEVIERIKFSSPFSTLVQNRFVFGILSSPKVCYFVTFSKWPGYRGLKPPSPFLCLRHWLRPKNFRDTARNWCYWRNENYLT